MTTSKSTISFLLNPAAEAQCPTSPEPSAVGPACAPMSPPALFQRLSPVKSDAAAYASSLMLLGSCIAPLEKANSNAAGLKKRVFSFTALCHDALSSTCSSSSDEEMDEDGSDHDHHHHDADASSTTSSSTKSSDSASISSSKPAVKPRVRKTRTPPCQVDGCKNIAVSRGCCVRHGGGSRCTVAGCSNRAKLYKRCFQHGGYKTCSTAGCTRKAKRYGHCWSHGGGRICEVPECTKVSTQGGLCWAHGGGNRCKLEGCSRRSYQKYGYYCVDHAALNTEQL